MKKLFALLFYVFSISLYAQDFAPLGATWHYGEGHAFSPKVTFITIESVKDTVIRGKNCRMLEHGTIECAENYHTDFVYYEDSIVYFYIRSSDTFNILYNFKAVKNDSWTIYFDVDAFDSLVVTVDSVSTATTNSKTLKRLHVTYTTYDSIFNIKYSSQIIETLGDVEFLFNHYSRNGFACDVNYSQGLRCYEDASFGFFSTGIADSCTYTTLGIKDALSAARLKVYPNPSSGNLNVRMEELMSSTYEIRDVTGKLLLSGEFAGETDIDINFLTPGIYVLSVKQDGQGAATTRIIKH